MGLKRLVRGALLKVPGARWAVHQLREEPRVNSFYNLDSPSTQAALDLYAGEWSSVLPPGIDGTTGGTAHTFEAPWITWFVDQIGGITDRNILELGPLECGHSYMLEQAGAASVVTVEANSRAFQRCLVIKNLLDLNRTKVLFGDFMSYLDDCPEFDILLASGVLYHMENPLSLLVRAARVAPVMLVWTHYYDAEWITQQGSAAVRSKFDHQATELVDRDHRATGYTYQYVDAVQWRGFCGGPRRSATWLPWSEIIRVLGALDFEVQAHHFVDDNPNGPVVYFVATRSDGDTASAVSSLGSAG